MENDLSDNAATQFLLTIEAGHEKYSPGSRALAAVTGSKMWEECRRRAENRISALERKVKELRSLIETGSNG